MSLLKIKKGDGTTESRRLSKDQPIAVGAFATPLPGTPLRGAAPSPIEDEVGLAMSRLESAGAMYGQWRKQVVTAERLRASARRP